MADAGGELLVLLLDTQLLQAGPLPADIALQQVLTFLKAHLLLNERNQQCLMAMHPGSSPVLYSTAENGADPLSLCAAATARLQQLLISSEKSSSGGSATGAPALSAALSRALCLINRHQRAQQGLSAFAATAAADAAGSGADASAGGGGAGAGGAPAGVGGAAAVARRRAKPRVLVVAGAADVPVQYIPTMNAIFSAQHAGVVIDALVLGPEDSAFLQQGAHITGGLYLRPTKPEGLLQYLLTVFAADTTTRGYLNLYQPTGVDYRASCFCHKRVIDTGFICSVCLSIFCKDNMRLPACPTCKSQFAGRGGGGGGGATAAVVAAGSSGGGAAGAAAAAAGSAG